jgi:hypothetical protein
VAPVAEAVEQEDDDGVHAARRLSRAACTNLRYPRGTRTTTVRLKPSR